MALSNIIIPSHVFSAASLPLPPRLPETGPISSSDSNNDRNNILENVPENVPEKVPEKVPENVPENVSVNISSATRGKTLIERTKILEFIHDRKIRSDKNNLVSLQYLYDDFLKWSQDRLYFTIGKINFSSRLRELGFEDQTANVIYFNVSYTVTIIQNIPIPFISPISNSKNFEQRIKIMHRAIEEIEKILNHEKVNNNQKTLMTDLFIRYQEITKRIQVY